MYYNTKELQDLLREYATKNSISYKYVITYFLQEEFLRRIMQSRYSSQLILRGSYLMYQMTDFESRTPLDIDFIYLNGSDYIEQVIDEIIKNSNESVVCFSRGVVYPPTPEQSFKGYSCQLTGNIGNLKHSFKINIAAAKAVVHTPEELSIPTILEKSIEPKINVCSIETVIAEKFDRILRRFELTDCMKDLYDIYILSGMFDFSGYELQRAVSDTLKFTDNDSNASRLEQIVGLGEDDFFINRWQHFCRVEGKVLYFNDVLNRFEKFLSPIWKSIQKGTYWKLEWSGISARWEDNTYLF